MLRCFINLNLIFILYLYLIFYIFDIFEEIVIVPKGLEREHMLSRGKLFLLLSGFPIFLNIILFYLSKLKYELDIVIHDNINLKRYNDYLSIHIDSIKKFRYPTHIKKIILEKYIDKEECPICLLIIDGNVTITKCGHIFHQECLENALDVNPKCPYCREMII